MSFNNYIFLLIKIKYSFIHVLHNPVGQKSYSKNRELYMQDNHLAKILKQVILFMPDKSMKDDKIPSKSTKQEDMERINTHR